MIFLLLKNDGAIPPPLWWGDSRYSPSGIDRQVFRHEAVASIKNAAALVFNSPGWPENSEMAQFFAY